MTAYNSEVGLIIFNIRFVFLICFFLTLNNRPRPTLYINVVSYFYASVNWLLYINYRGPLGQSQYKNYQFTFSLFTITSLQHETLKTLTKKKKLNMQVLCLW